MTSANASKIFNIHPKKGTIAPGSDADLVVWDPEKTRTISRSTHHQNIDFNIYEGMSVTGNAAVTLSRGMVVWEKDQLRTEKGWGKNVDRPPFPAYWASQRLRNQQGVPTPVARKLPAPAALATARGTDPYRRPFIFNRPVLANKIGQ